MKWILLAVISASFIGLAFIKKKKPADPSPTTVFVPGNYTPIAVLELFTSEGCSSCPSADRLLPQLSTPGTTVISLSFHVDYWNRLGWEDPFSSSDYSDRQRAYANQMKLESVYTPQLIVNGEYELVGSNRVEAAEAIKKALEEKAIVQLRIGNVKRNADQLSFTIHSEGDFKKSNLLAALVQKKATVNVRSGENGGAKLSHTNVVRIFSTQPAADKNEFQLSVPADLANDNWELIVYTQQKNSLKITGAALYHPTNQ